MCHDPTEQLQCELMLGKKQAGMGQRGGEGAPEDHVVGEGLLILRGCPVGRAWRRRESQPVHTQSKSSGPRQGQARGPGEGTGQRPESKGQRQREQGGDDRTRVRRGRRGQVLQSLETSVGSSDCVLSAQER